MPGNDSYTKLLIHSDTTDGSTTFVDSAVGGAGHTVTPAGDVHHETDAQKFGATSIYHDGTGDKLTIPAHADFDFSASDFTIDCWFRMVGAVSQTIFSSDIYGFYIFFDAGYQKLNFGLSSNGTSYNIYAGVANSTKTSWNQNQWYHIALVWDGTNYKVYVDGTLDITVVSGTGLHNTLGIQTGIHAYWGYALNGYIDEFRVSKGIARWTENFTPPTEAYTEEATEVIIDLNSDISADFLTGWLDLLSEITAGAETFYNLNSGIEAGSQIITDLLSEIVANAQSITDLFAEIKARDYVFYDLKTSIEAVRSKWWLKSEIKAGCSARYSFISQWNPNRFLMTEIAAKKPYAFSFNTVSGAPYAATSPQIEILTATGTYPLRTLFLDYITPGSENEYAFRLWFGRGLGVGDTLKNTKIKAEYINTTNGGGFEIVELGIISVKIGDGEYQTISTTPLLLGDILADSYLDLSLKLTIRDCTLSRGLIFFKLIFTGDKKESIFGDEVVYGDGSQYFLSELDDYTSNDFICRLYIVE